MKPKATIMIPAYNAEKFIGEALESSINQNYNGPYEILVVNDGSTDDTQGKVEYYGKKDKRIRLINQENVGQPKTRNKLFRESRGEILLGLDADDFLHPVAVEKVVNCFEKNPSVGFTYTNQAEIDEKGKLLRELKRDNVNKYLNDLIFHCQFVGHLRSFRKSQVDNQNLEFDYRLKTAQDWGILFDMHGGMKIKHVPETLYSYRINSEGISISNKEEVVDTSVKLIRRNIEKMNLCNGKKFEVVPVNPGNGIMYYDHLVEGGSAISKKPKARKALERYLLEGY